MCVYCLRAREAGQNRTGVYLSSFLLFTYKYPKDVYVYYVVCVCVCVWCEKK